MTTKKAAEMKYVVLVGLEIFLIILCNVIVDKNPMDIIYLSFMLICAIRYIIVCKKS